MVVLGLFTKNGEEPTKLLIQILRRIINPDSGLRVNDRVHKGESTLFSER